MKCILFIILIILMITGWGLWLNSLTKKEIKRIPIVHYEEDIKPKSKIDTGGFYLVIQNKEGLIPDLIYALCLDKRTGQEIIFSGESYLAPFIDTSIYKFLYNFRIAPTQ